MLDGHVLVDAHMHVGKLSTVSPAWHRWADGFGDGATIEVGVEGDELTFK